MRALLLLLLITCVCGFVVSSGIAPLPFGRDPRGASATAISHSLPVLLAVGAPAILFMLGMAARAVFQRTGYLPLWCALGLLVGGTGYMMLAPDSMQALLAGL